MWPLLLSAHALASTIAGGSAKNKKLEFPTVEQFREVATVVGALGLRTPASPRHNILVDYLLAQLAFIEPLEITTQDFPIRKWQTLNDSTLLESGSLSIRAPNSLTKNVPIVGAIPWTRPTNGQRVNAPLVYVPQEVNLTTANVTGRIVVRDFGPVANIPFPQFFGLSYYRSNDTNSLANTSYSRPYTGSPGRDLVDAGLAGAVGFISLFNASRKDVESYFDPHEGTHYNVPGVYAGVEEANVLKDAAARGWNATLSVEAEVRNTTQRQINARLGGSTNETIYVVSHTDGNTFVQDNGVSALVNLARYFAGYPLEERTKTIEFVFTTGHLGYASDSTITFAQHLDSSYDTDETVLVIALEHMGTREILPVGSPSGAANGRELQLTGHNEIMLWCVGPSEVLQNISIASAKMRNLDRILIARGASAPNPNAVPEYASFGGIGTSFHQHLVPTTSIISGPWSLWANRFGSSAVDYNRLRDQTQAFADLILAVQLLSKHQIAGNYTRYRQERASGKLWALDPTPPIFAPLRDTQV
jgi:hypothetical protein